MYRGDSNLHYKNHSLRRITKMPFQLSPGVAVVEKDFSSIVPAVSSSVGAFAGLFTWGPVLDPVTISSENNLVSRFGAPTDANAQSFFTAANFLSYTNNLLTVRVDTENSKNSVASAKSGVSSITVVNAGEGYLTAPQITISEPNIPVSAGGVQATAVAVLGVDATAGTVVSINITNPGYGYTTAPTVTFGEAPEGGTNATATAVLTTATGIKIKNLEDYTTNYINGAGDVGAWAAKYPGSLGNSLLVSVADSTTFANWSITISGVGTIDLSKEFDSAPGTSTYASNVGASNDELHVIIIDEDGAWTGTRGAILEKFAFVSKGSDAKKSDGANNYYRDVVNSQSRYIWWMDHPTALAGSGDNWGQMASNKVFKNLAESQSYSLSGGVDDLEATDSDLENGFAIFANDELYDISLIAAGKASANVAEFIINNVAESRKDCVVFISPENTSTGNIIIGSGSDAVNDINDYVNELPSSSYAVVDSGFKYQYDRYNDKYRYVPLNGDVAGLCARTDYTNDPWFSPGGYNRGQIKNVVKLAVNPGKTERDNLYKNNVNPVVNFPGQGVVLFGDKTLQKKPSAFDRINVRRLFIVLEKAIATAAKYQLFEFNDDFTRAQFKNLVEPFLRDVQGRRGITDFRVKCDDTNNTGEVIDRNEFVADIFIKPARSINFITLNFVAARSAVNFSEIGA
jgi:phage tail sheath protein FI